MEKSYKSEEYSSHHYSVDDDSPSNQSPADSRLYSRETFHNEGAVSRWSMSNAGSSRNLLEVAEDTIEELRAEAKMWERNARKLMIDFDITRKDLSDLSKKHAELGVELSAANAENDGLKRQVEKVKEELQQLAMNIATREAPVVESRSLQKELEEEIKYQQNLNHELGQQLKQSQESNIELVSVLQELEETIEQQRVEIENLSSLESEFVDLHNSMDTSSEANKSLLLQLEKLEESEKNLKSDVQLLEEALREKTDELEKERESFREILSQRERELHKENEVNLMREIESLKEKVRELEKDCSELTDENLELLFKLKASNNTDIRKCSSFDSMTSEHHPASYPSDDSEVSDPRDQVSNVEEEEVEKEESSLHFAEILEQIDIAFHLLMKPCHRRISAESDGYIHGVMISEKINTARMSVEYIRSLLQELNKLLETRIEKTDEILRNHEHGINERDAIISEARKKMEERVLEVQELERTKAEREVENASLMREVEEKITEVDLMEAEFLSKEEETNALLQRRRELEAQVSELQQKAIRLEQDLEVALTERKISSECIKNLESEVTVLSEAVSSHVSEKTSLERNMKELEMRGIELEKTLSELQEENARLEESVSDQEARVQQLKDEKRAILQEMEDYKSSAMTLQDEMFKLKEEMEIQILDLKQKSDDVRKQWLGTQEECAYLKEENEALDASATSSALEIAELQNMNSELKRENQELHKRCCELVDQLSEMEKRLFDCTKKVESLTSVQDEFLQRENHLKSERDALVKENSYQKEKLAGEESLHQLLSEKTKEVECFSKKLSDAHEERERFSIEVSSLLEEKAELQASLQEAKLEAESTKNELDAARQESESKVQELTDQLAASIQSYERLMTDYERVLKSVAKYRKVEEKLKTELNGIELKHTISDYERQQLTKEVSSLKVRLQRISELEDEVSFLKSELEEFKLDKGRLELALHTISGDYDELKGEKMSLCEKISVFEAAMLEFEECRRNKACAEEKLLQMEKDLSAKEVLHTQNEELKKEVAETKRSNVQFQQRMYRLEMEKDECLKRVQALEDDLKQMQERNTIHKEVNIYY